MKDELLKQSAEIIAILKDSLLETKNLAIEQLPDIAQQYITYGFYMNLIGVIIGLLLFIPCIFLFKKCANCKKDLHVYGDTAFVFFFTSFLCGFSSILFLSIAGTTLLKIAVAPKVWLLQELAKLLT